MNIQIVSAAEQQAAITVAEEIDRNLVAINQTAAQERLPSRSGLSPAGS